MRDLRHYTLLAEMFRYPDSGYRNHVKEIQGFLYLNFPEAALEFSPFAKYIQDATEEQMEELYTKTFDVQPVSYLDIGYVLFVEDYKRGEFLVNMKVEQNEVNNDCGSELPDNIVNVLTYIPKTKKSAFLNDLIAIALVPALKKMIAEFQEARVELKLKVIKKMHKAIIQEELNTGNVYQYALKALLMVLEEDFKDALETYNQSLAEISNKMPNNFLKTSRK